MAEYIDRDALKDRMAGFVPPFIDESNQAYVDGLTDAYTLICQAPTADVVEVVRCKDCFNRTKSGMCIQWSRYEKIVNTPDYAFCRWGGEKEWLNT